MNYQELLSAADKLPKYETENKYEYVEEDADETNFNENDECCICLEKDKLWKTSCNHIICKNCIPNIQNKDSCPLCRKNIYNELEKVLNKKKKYICIEGFSFSDPNYYYW